LEKLANHSGAGKCVPTESDAITILYITPLVLQSFIIHLGWRDKETMIAEAMRGEAIKE
jgi:hypothetical protein